MLSSLSLRNAVRWNRPITLLRQQINIHSRVTPILSYHLRHKKEDQKLTTGFVNGESFAYKPSSFSRSIHSHSALYLKYSNLLEQKVGGDNEKKIAAEDKTATDPLLEPLEENQKLGLFARFKKMAKDYWYVLIPVHVATSAVWLGAFFYTSKSGVDIVGMMEYYEFSETIIKPLRNSHLGHIAVAYFLYKVATPARYAVTLGGTTFAIKFLSQRGIIKPMPSRDQMVKIYQDKKLEMKEKVADKKQEFRDKVEDKKQEFREKVADKKQEFEDKKQEFRDIVEDKKQELRDRKQEFQDKYMKKE